MLQLALTVSIYLLIVIPAGVYLYHIAAGKHTFADPVFDRVDGAIYKISGVDPGKGMNWKQYALALLGTNAVMVFIGYLILRVQSAGLFNPNNIENMEPTLAFNTIISFMTNTNLQHYSGESGLSYLSQMLVIIFMMFVSAASGYAACVAFIRGLAGRTKNDVGNFFADLVRITTRILLPFSIVGGLLLVWQGVPQNFEGNVVVETLEGTFQVIAMGPIAALEIIKHLGTNGGGFLGANSSTPLENPTMLSNLIELYSMMLLPGACVITFGKMVHARRQEAADGMQRAGGLRARGGLSAAIYGREGRSIFAAMGILFVIGLSVCFWAESQGNPALADIGLDQAMGSMEGKEVRFGIAQSAMFTTVTTSFTTGTVNNMHDTLTPLGGMIPLLHMMLNVVFGGKGVGLMNMILYAILAVFICGLMIGRTPEYLGKKIEGREMTRQQGGGIRPAEAEPVVFPRRFRVCLVAHHDVRPDEKYLARAHGEGPPGRRERPAAGNDVVDEIVIPHARAPAVAGCALLKPDIFYRQRQSGAVGFIGILEVNCHDTRLPYQNTTKGNKFPYQRLKIPLHPQHISLK